MNTVFQMKEYLHLVFLMIFTDSWNAHIYVYFQVNFSKKRKNRMRNDEAAIIALSKSRSQYLHKDTDSLVDNEAVIVYDERTALWKRVGVGDTRKQTIMLVR